MKVDNSSMRLYAVTDRTWLKQDQSLEWAVEEALKTKPPLAAIDAIALVESGLSRLCDVTVAVTAPVDVRVARLMVRDRIPESYARARIAAQPSEDFFRTHCDYVLENNGTAQEFREKCLAFFSGLVIMKP